MKFNEFNNGDTKTMKTMTSKEKKQAFLDVCMDKFESDSNGTAYLDNRPVKRCCFYLRYEVCTSMDCKKSC